MTFERVDVTQKVIVPAGTYMVGDPCYNVPNERWMEWLEAADFRDKPREHVLVAELDGYPIVGVSTATGDGSYFDQTNREYGVDAGMIGLVPFAFASMKYGMSDQQEAAGIAHKIVFDESVECYYDKGVIHIGSLAIDTGPEWSWG